MSRITPPAESGIRDWSAGSNLVDSFAIVLPTGAPEDVSVLATLLFSDPPPWFTILLAIRNRMVSLFGIRSSNDLVDGDHINFFPVLSRAPNEIVVGADDSHLDFRASVLLRRTEHTLVVTTAVRCHNLLGRTYLAVILPFHILVVTTLLRRLRHRF